MRFVCLAGVAAALALASPSAALATPFTSAPRTSEVNGQRVTVHADQRRSMAAVQDAMNRSSFTRIRSADLARDVALPTTWCGTPRTTDDTADDLHATAQKFKVIYAYASDRPNRAAAQADTIQTMVSQAIAYYADQSDHTKSLRFDLGTDCGPAYVDIATVKLPKAASYYQVTSERFFRILDDMQDMLGAMGVADGTNLVVFADGLGSGDGVVGESTWEDDDNPDPRANRANQGNQAAMLYGDDAYGDMRYGGSASLVHEMTHSLGSVNKSAPNATDYGHCTDEADVMCYVDSASTVTRQVCDYQGDQDGVLDCNRDDYFNPAPAAGSYLATHWNTYNSSYLCALAECTTPDTTAPAQPAGVRMERNKWRMLKISWKTAAAADGVTGYRVYNRGKEVKPRPRITRGGGRVYARWISFTSTRKLRLTVKAYDAAGNYSAPSRTVGLTTKSKPKKTHR